MVVTPTDAQAFADCIAQGGVAVFPADTVYGLACDPESAEAVRRLYQLKGRPPDKPAAVMWFDRARALEGLPELGERTRAAIERLTPGGVTLLLLNPHARFPLAAGLAGEGGAGPAGEGVALGVRIPRLTGPVEALVAVPLVVLQSSANHTGGPDARTLKEIPDDITSKVDLVLDAGPLPGAPSTVIDLRTYERDGEWRILREGAVAAEAVATALGIVGRR